MAEDLSYLIDSDGRTTSENSAINEFEYIYGGGDYTEIPFAVNVKWVEQTYATAGQLVFQTAKDVTNADIHLNGSLLSLGVDYTIIEPDQIVLTKAAALNDIIVASGGEALPASSLGDKITAISTIDQLSGIDITLYQTAIVEDDSRGGTFHYDNLQSDVNNNGTIFDGWVRQYKGDIYPEWFGADEASTDNSTTLSNMFTIIEGIFNFNEKKYTCLSNLNISTNRILKNGELDFSGLSSGGVGSIYFSGTGIISTTTATADILLHDTTIAVADASIFDVGDLFSIVSTEIHKGGEANEYLGEMNRVISKNGNTLTVEFPISYNYSIAEATINELSLSENNAMINMIITAPTDTGKNSIHFEYCDNPIVENCTINGNNRMGIRISQSFNATITKNSIISTKGTQVANEAVYGVGIINNARSFYINDNVITCGRHGVAFSADGGGGTSIDCYTDNNIVSSTHGAAFATHQNSKKLSFKNNKIEGAENGFDIRSNIVAVEDNTITLSDTATLGNGVILRKHPENISIRGNKFYLCRYGVNVSEFTSTTTLEYIDISGNQFSLTAINDINLVNVLNTDSIHGLTIRNNKFLSTINNNIVLDGNFLSPEITDNYALNDASNPTFYAIVMANGCEGAKIFRNSSVGRIIANIGESTHAVPVKSSKTNIANNMFETTSFVTISSGIYDTVRSRNIQTGISTALVITSNTITVPFGTPSAIVSPSANTDITTINGCDMGDVVTFISGTNSYSATFKDGVGLSLVGDFTLSSNSENSITLIKTGYGWTEVSRSITA